MTEQPSPSWGSTTKLIVGLTVVALITALLIQFRNIIGPLILAFMLAYILHPVAGYLSKAMNVSWRASVNIIFLLLVVALGALITATGLAVAEQVQSLVSLVQRSLMDLPTILANLSEMEYRLGPFTFDFSQFDLESLANQALTTIQPLLGRVGGLVSTFAASAVVTLGWVFFILLIAYFLLADATQVTGELIRIDVPGYNEDIRRLGQQLKSIWNAFLRGQLIITLLVLISYYLLMLILDVRFALAISLVAGVGRFVPYVGPLTAWTVTSIVAFFQSSNYFGLSSLNYVILVVLAALILDQIFDNLVVPRFFGQTLGVHPAAVLVAAIIAANLIGIIGLLLAAPVLATLKVLARYVVRKMLDLDPWPETDAPPPKLMIPWRFRSPKNKAEEQEQKGIQSSAASRTETDKPR